MFCTCSGFAVMTLAGILLAGNPVLQFVPTERISLENLDRLELVLKWKVNSASLHGELPNAVQGVAVDGAGRVLYLHLQRNLDSLLSPAGIFTYDLQTGRRLRRTRVPERLDMSGDRRNAYGHSFIDVKRKVAWYSTVMDPNPADRSIDVLMELDLTQDRPRLLANDMGLARFPDLGDGKLLLWSNKPGAWQKGLAFLDGATGRIEGPYELPQTSTVNWDAVGGAGAYVVAEMHEHDELPDGTTRGTTNLAVLMVKDERLAIVAKKDLQNDTGSLNQAIDRWGKRWVVVRESNEVPSSSGPAPAPIEVYGIPDLQPLGRLPGFVDARVGVLRDLRIVVALPREKDRSLVLLDEKTGRHLRRLSIPIGKQNDRLDDFWRAFVDPDGFFIGAYGAHSVALFAIRPRENG